MIDEALYKQYYGAILKGEKHKCLTIVEKLIDQHHDAKDIYLNLFQASLYEIGHEWEIKTANVATEHILSNITESLIERVYAHFVRSPRHGKKLLITTCDDEYHTIGAKIVCDFCEINGWTAYFLGASTPTDDLLAMIQQVEADVLGLSLTMADKQDNLIYTCQQVHRLFPKVGIILGGQAIDELSVTTREILKSCQARHLASLGEVEEYLKGYQLQEVGS